jgi:hypothetical protein
MELGDSRLATDACPVTVTDLVNTNHLPPYCNIHSGSGGKIIHENKEGDTGW